MIDVLLTNAWLRTSYASLRNLTSHGLNVAISDSRPIGISQFSNKKIKQFLYSDYALNEDKFCEDILKICKENKIKYILPAHNETEIISRRLKADYPQLCRMIPSIEQISIFNNKKKSYDLADSLGIKVPKRFDYTCMETLKKALMDDPREQYVIKLLKSNSSKGVFYGRSINEVLSIASSLIKKFSLPSERYPQIEEYVDGVGVGSSYLFWDGEKMLNFGHERVTERIETGGTSTFRKHFSDDNINAASQKILETVNYHGLAMVEFKFNKKTGEYWFIEVNPRMWGSMPFAISCGANFPFLAYSLSNNEYKPDRDVKNYISEDKKGMWLMGHLVTAFNHLLKAKPKKFLRTLAEINKADTFDDFHYDDFGAFIGQIFGYIYNSFRSLFFNDKKQKHIG